MILWKGGQEASDLRTFEGRRSRYGKNILGREDSMCKGPGVDPIIIPIPQREIAANQLAG